MRKAWCIARPEKQGETLCATSHQQSVNGECCNARPAGFTDTANCLMNQTPHCRHDICHMSCPPTKGPKGERDRSDKGTRDISLSNQSKTLILLLFTMFCPFVPLSLLSLLSLCARLVHVPQHHFLCLQTALSGVVTACGMVKQNRFSASLTV